MEKFFKLSERNTTVSKELIGGITTFLAMAYILAVNPSILSGAGMSWGAVFTATALSAAIATLVMAFCANLPVALAPGLGLNAFFTYTVVLGMGCSFQLALTAVLLEGVLFIILSICGIREAIIKSIPEGLKKAVAVGIGLFIAIIGLANALMAKPEFMVLDEPINGLDPEGIVEIRELFRKLNKEEDITMVISSHILSELSLLCTDYIFINHGQIKGIFTADELQAECSEYYQIDTDNNEKASVILSKTMGIEKLDVQETGQIRIYEKLDDIHDISKALYEGGVIPVEISKNEINLEDYYMRKVQEG